MKDRGGGGGGAGLGNMGGGGEERRNAHLSSQHGGFQRHPPADAGVTLSPSPPAH
ncbi:hypothetical protein JZ751_002518 [Albula glossodonta]|uniref:Uncharacterized protein n=1 Tax=Albula glossodonta TaxID=121402 RepID=A0A8T2NBL9_9TELE|nr:hypothetical protein JZ751_002518 [Albula glossodonta]